MADDIFRKLYRKNQAALTKLQADGEIRIVRIYSDALSGIREELRRLYRKYQKDGKLSNADKTVYNRLKQLEEHIRDVLNRKNLEIDELLKVLTAEQYEESFYRMAYAFDMAGGIEFSWGLIPEEAVAEIARSPLEKLSQSKAVQAARDDAFTRIRRDIELAIIRGDSFQTLARRIGRSLGVAKTGNGYEYSRSGLTAKAMTIARTEGMRALNAGHQRAYQEAREMGCDIVEMWDATIDSRTRPSHGALDGKYRDEEHGGWYVPELGRYVEGPGKSGEASFDINCRCRVTAHVRGFPPAGRYTRGKGTDEPYQTYTEWRENIEINSLHGHLPLTTPLGHTVRRLTMHFYDRKSERSVPEEDIIDALLHPIHTEDRGYNAKKQHGYRYIGKKATVNINPEDARITTIWVTGKDKIKKYTGER